MAGASLLQEVLTPQELQALGLTEAVRHVDTQPFSKLSLRQYIQIRWALVEYCFLRMILCGLIARGVYSNWAEVEMLFGPLRLPWWIDPALLFAVTAPFICIGYEVVARPTQNGGHGAAASLQKMVNAYNVNCVMLLDVAFIIDMHMKGRSLLAVLGAVLYLGFHILPRSILAVVALNGLYSPNPLLSWDALLVPTRETGVVFVSSLRSLLGFTTGASYRRQNRVKRETATTSANNSRTCRKDELAFSYLSPAFSILRASLRTRVFFQRFASLAAMCTLQLRPESNPPSPTEAQNDLACDSPDSTLLWPPPQSRSVSTGGYSRPDRRWASAVLESLSPGWRSARNFVYSQLAHRSGRSPQARDDVGRSHTEVEMVGPDAPLQEDSNEPTVSCEADAVASSIDAPIQAVPPPRRSLGMTPDAYRVLMPEDTDQSEPPPSSPPPTSPSEQGRPAADLAPNPPWRRVMISEPNDAKLLETLDYVTGAVAAPLPNAALLDCFALITEAYYVADGLKSNIAADLEEQLEFLFSILVLLYMHVTALGLNLLRFHCLIVPVVIEGVSSGSFSVTNLVGLVLSIAFCLTLFFGAAYDEQIVNAIIDAI